MNSAEKEAIATLNEHLEHWKRLLSEKICDQDEGEKTIDALQNAIKALEQEPCDDCIRRSDVGLTDFEIIMCNGDYREGLKILLEKIAAAPSVTPQPKMGRWVMSDEGLYRPICNNCGAHPWKGYIPTVEEATESFKYCPHCGCAMQEVEG